MFYSVIDLQIPVGIDMPYMNQQFVISIIILRVVIHLIGKA